MVSTPEFLGPIPCCKPSTKGGTVLKRFNPYDQRTNSPILSPYFSYESTVEKLLKHQGNLPWVITPLILMTPGVEEALILQGKI